MRSGTKAPRLKGWQDRRLTQAEAELEFRQDDNIGVLTGDPSGWLVDVDLDSELAVQLADKHLPQTELVSGRETRPGSHRWYIVKEAAYRKWSVPDGAIELRATGQQTLVGPSVHPEGDRYAHLEGTPTEIEPGPFMAALHSLAAAAGYQPDKTDDNLQRQSCSAETWLDEQPVARAGEHGHDQTFAVAKGLWHGWGLSETETVRLLRDRYNPRCDPPWDEEDLRRKVSEAATKTKDPRPRGYLREKNQAKKNGRPAALQLQPMSEIPRQSIDWLWPGLLAKGKVCLIAGDPGVGKSTLTAEIAGRLSVGAWLPGGASSDEPVKTLLISSEDDAGDTIRPRLEAANADLERVLVVDTNSGAFGLQSGLDSLRTQVTDWDIGLVVIDPFSAYLQGANEHRNSDIREIMRWLASMAQETSSAVLVVSHLNKSQEGNALRRTMGSIGLPAASRTVWHVVKDTSDSSKRLLLPVKSNIGHDHGGYAFTINGPGIRWLGEVHMDADEYLSTVQANASRRRAPREAEAADLLREVLADGEKPVNEIEAIAAARGIKSAALRRAKESIGVQSSKISVSGGWSWSLPKEYSSCSPSTHTLSGQGAQDDHVPGEQHG